MKLPRFESSNHLLGCGALALALTLALGGAHVAAQALSAENEAASLPAETESATPNATGSGTINHLARWTSSTALGDSVMKQINGKIGIGNANPPALLTVDGSDQAAPTIRGANSSSGKGVLGTSASGTGVAGASTSGVGVQGSVTGANNAHAAILGQTSSKAVSASGVTGQVTSTAPGKGSAGVRGINNGKSGPDGPTYGVYGTSVHSAIGNQANIGVRGESDTGVSGEGIYVGVSGSGYDVGVEGRVVGDHDSYGVYGVKNGNKGAGVFGAAADAVGVTGTGLTGTQGISSAGAGVVGYSTSGTGVAGQSETGAGVTGQSKDHFGVYGVSTNSYAGYFDGNVHVNGTLSKSAGSFEIDHPLDPANKYLRHSFVESPEMKNIYDGNVELDEHGEATVEMPDYFTALNQDYRYQLTAMGAPGPNLYVADEIKENRFKIAGGKPGTRVSWQVTGVRHDAYANAHRIAVESPKSPAQIGHYLNPEAFGQPAELAIGKLPVPASIQEPQHAAAK